MKCPACSAEYAAGDRFCHACGAALELACPTCGTPYQAGHQFCASCGTRLGPAAAPAPRAEPPRAPAALSIAPVAPAAERRLVTVLFLDLVGFTAASEHRDAEETRELLSRYFELARTVISRYGGTVEKFIGDAVMAVWGTPTATEDDAERAVRAAMELVTSVPDLDPELQARAGVMTGDAAVTIGATGEGMVAGDLVNTASRVQAAAPAGAVLVGDATRRASQESIAYESLGHQEVKGRDEPVAVWRALRVVSGRGGSLKSTGLEPPFVGRDRELKLIKDLFHGSAQERKAHLVSVTGIAGIGKSRLAWEFYKYFDGVVETVWWHRGRSLAYGEGVAFWALADMVRMRCRIVEDEEPASAREKLRATLELHVPDAGERAYVEPRLAHLLGLEEARTTDRQDLFGAWRLFFERLADQAPTVLAFEDLQWADASLLDFIEYLLEWSRAYPIFVITLARPELHERRPGWGAGQRSFTSLYLEPLSEEAMGQLLAGLVPGLPERLLSQILARAQGVPLYAVETVRMLIDRGLLVPDGPAFRLTGEVEQLEVPETLQALIAARLDGLSPEERRLLQDAAVLGKTFSRSAIAALSGQPEQEIEPVLSSLLRKEVLSLQADPRSPERGQYAFLQDLVRHVAYESLSKRDRKQRHLAAAAHLLGTFAQEEEVAEVLASHLVAAYAAAPDAEDAPEIRTRACAMLVLAGDRAASLGAPEEGRRYYAQAADLTDDRPRQAELLEQAGRLAGHAAHPAEARTLLERSMAIRVEAGDTRGAARVSAIMGEIDADEGRLHEGVERLQQAVAGLETERPNAEVALALAQLGRLRAISGEHQAAAPDIERALDLAERLQLQDVFLDALTTKGLILYHSGRLQEARILLEAAIERAGSEQLYAAALRASNNLAVVLEASDRPLEAMGACQRVLELARMRGARRWEQSVRTGMIIDLYHTGRWDEALANAAEEESQATSESARLGLIDAALIQMDRGELAAAKAIIERAGDLRTSDQAQARASFLTASARLLRAEGRPGDVAPVVDELLALRGSLHVTDERVKRGLVEGIEAAVAVGDLGRADELLAIPRSLDPGLVTPCLAAQTERLTARIAALRGEHEQVEERFRRAEALLLPTGHVFSRAVALLEHAEWLAGQGREAEARPLAEEAAAAFESMGARPWLDRAAALGGVMEPVSAQG